MAKLTREDILHLARLSRLSLSEAEVERFGKEIQAVLEYVEQLGGVDVEGYEPTTQVTGLTNVSRPDEIMDYGCTPDALLGNVPAMEEGHIKVHRMIA